MSDPRSRPAARQRRERMVVGLLCVAVLLAVAVYIGGRSPWGTKHPHVANGVAMRANSDNDLVTFEGDDGKKLMFGSRRIWWRSGDAQGEGSPPCLETPLERVDVKVGFLWIAAPEGGAFQQAVWVQCP